MPAVGPNLSPPPAFDSLRSDPRFVDLVRGEIYLAQPPCAEQRADSIPTQPGSRIQLHGTMPNAYFPPTAVALVSAGSVSATSAVLVPPPVANTMYCFPLCRNVIGGALVFDGIWTAPTCFPVALSTA